MDRTDSIAFEVRKTARSIKRFLDTSTNKSCADQLTGTHGWVIGYLYDHRNEDIYQRDFEKACNIRRSTATSILQLMEKNGLLIREPVPFDARLKKLKLTEKAVELHKRVDKDFQTLEQRLRQGLEPQEIECLLGALKKIRQEVDENDQAIGEEHSGI